MNTVRPYIKILIHIWINRYCERYKVTAKANRHLGKNTTDGIFSITRNMDVALMRPKWIFDKPMSLCANNTNLGIYESVSLKYGRTVFTFSCKFSIAYLL